MEYLRGPRPDGMDCERPLWVLRDDGTTDLWRCSGTRTSRCRPCATRYRRRVTAVAAAGFTRPGGFAYLLTGTAPGDAQHCKRAGCDGRLNPAGETTCGHKRCQCTPPGGVDLARWNPTCGKRWNHLLTSITDHYRVRPRYFRAVEVQDGTRRDDGIGRGALHLHALLWSPRQLDERTVRRLAVAAGFGHSLRLDLVDVRSAAVAQYVTKKIAGYVTKSSDARDDVPWIGQYIDYETGELLTGRTAARYRTWSQSQDWGTSMALIRRAAMDKAKQLQQLRDASVHSATVAVSAPDPLTTGTSPPP